MELWTKASYIEEIKESFQKRYNSLKSELKKEGNILNGKKQRSIAFAEEMARHANLRYYEIKHLMEQASKTDRVAKQIKRNMKSIKSYKEKIYNLFNYDCR